jgi:hypothetical protein
MEKYVKHLKLEGKVKFRGHTDDIKKAAMTEKLNMVWFHGYHGVPGGFAGFDICTTGIPQIFWNFGSASVAEKKDIFPMYSDLEEFVKMSIELLSDQKASETLSHLQYDHVLQTRDIKRYILSLEKLYSSIALKKQE